MKKTSAIFFLIFLTFLTCGYKKPDVYEIDAVRNAYIHNNKGLNYVQDRLYYPAIQEFKIAISLNPNTQATAVYYNNLGEVYMKIGAPDLAVDCFERAILQFSLNLKYYKNLAEYYRQKTSGNKRKLKPSEPCNARHALRTDRRHQKSNHNT